MCVVCFQRICKIFSDLEFKVVVKSAKYFYIRREIPVSCSYLLSTFLLGRAELCASVASWNPQLLSAFTPGSLSAELATEAHVQF